MQTYQPGKLPPEHLGRLFARYGTHNERVVLGPGIGHDAAVISFGDRYLVAKTDPITFASDGIGWYAVHINANDIACTGATARWFLVTLLIPEGEGNAGLVDTIFAQVAKACAELNVGLVGGHTEITYDIDRPIVVGCMLGEVTPERLVRPNGARPGDVLLVTKGIAIEGTAIIAREIGGKLGGVDASFIARCRDFLYNPGISVVRDAAIAVEAGEVHAMHDPTEGGLATGLWELAEAAGVGIEVDESALPILPETRILGARLGLDPLGLIASGTLLLAVAPADASAICEALESAGIAATAIGRVVERERGLTLHYAGNVRPLPRFERDELVAALVGTSAGAS